MATPLNKAPAIPLFVHFGMSCGLEVVLGDGRILRTADGALPGAKTWNVTKYGYGPYLDGLFLQSNFGIVTRLGVWLMPRPPAIRSFFFLFPDDEDFGDIIELVRPLKLNKWFLRSSRSRAICMASGRSPAIF